jgi:hypothetical protein
MFIQVLSRPGDALALEVAKDFTSGIVAGCTGDTASRMAPSIQLIAVSVFVVKAQCTIIGDVA